MFWTRVFIIDFECLFAPDVFPRSRAAALLPQAVADPLAGAAVKFARWRIAPNARKLARSRAAAGVPDGARSATRDGGRSAILPAVSGLDRRPIRAPFVTACFAESVFGSGDAAAEYILFTVERRRVPSQPIEDS